MSDAPVRLFVDALPVEGATVALDHDARHHARVLRLAVGDRVRLFDGSGREMDAVVSEVDRDVVRCVVGAARDATPAGPRVHLVQALPKAKKLDVIVRMVTELGVDDVHLASSERAVPKVEAARALGKLERLTRVVKEAARQSRRPTIPALHPIEPLLSVAARAPSSAEKLVFWEESDTPLDAAPIDADVWVVIGPEGGLSHTEVDALGELGYRPRSLGPTTLRVETAGPVAVALVLDRLRRFSSRR